MKKQKQLSIRGIKDYLPSETYILKNMEQKITKILNNYGFNEIKLPIFEKTNIFENSIGETTEIIKKEMYSFKDRKGNKLTLRPEGTTGCIRAGIEHDLFKNNQEQRIWYTGPMFRYERPQQGRYRQFYQLGIEIFGSCNIYTDIEIMLISNRIWKTLQIKDKLLLNLNSIGSKKSFKEYKKKLLIYIKKNINQFKENNIDINKIYNDPTKIFNIKNQKIQNIIKHAPLTINNLDEKSKNNFSNICNILNTINIKYKINPYLMRGLNYYNQTIFEWTTSYLGAQNTICAGGRYDNLVKQLGGINIPATGCAIGLDRLLILIKKINKNLSTKIKTDIYIIYTKDNQEIQKTVISITEKIRNKLPHLRIITDYNTNTIKKQFKKAVKKYNTKIVLIIGIQEVKKKEITIKNLNTKTQKTIPIKNIIQEIKLLISINTQNKINTHETINK